MSEGTWGTVLGGVGTLLGIASGVLGLWLRQRQAALQAEQLRTQKEQLALSRALAAYTGREAAAREAAKSRASVHAVLRRDGKGWLLVIENRGAAAARQIDFEYPDEARDPPIVTRGKEIPIDRLQAGGEYAFVTAATMTNAPPWVLLVRWKNEDGTEEQETFLLK